MSLTERTGQLTDGTEYRIAVPASWSGVAISDLDAAISIQIQSDHAKFLYSQGYAYMGTNRRPDRNHRFDPRAERDQQAEVLDLFEAEFGKPQQTIQFGCSGGGGVALGVAEKYPERVDGAISANGAEPIVMANQRLDLLFALKTLLAEGNEVPVVGIEYEGREEAAASWRALFDKALQSPIGRARAALAGALAQVPVWGGVFAPYLAKPDPKDRDAVQYAAVRSVFDAALYAAGVRFLYDSPAGVMSWNVDIDYQRHFDNAEPSAQAIVRELYLAASAKPDETIHGDLESVNSAPRVAARPSALSYWRERALTGSLQVPLLQVNTVGDSSRSTAVMAAYAECVEVRGRTDFYRQALIDAPGHCTFATAEMGALVVAMLRRLDTGHWGSLVDPDNLNELGQSFEIGRSRFISTVGLPQRDNRAYVFDTNA